MPMHGTLELALGIAMMASPLALGFQTAGALVVLAIGALLVGLALEAASSEGSGGISLGTHAAADSGLAVAMLGAGSALGVAGDVTAFAFLAASGLIQLLLQANTRYSAVRA